MVCVCVLMDLSYKFIFNSSELISIRVSVIYLIRTYKGRVDWQLGCIITTLGSIFVLFLSIAPHLRRMVHLAWLTSSIETSS